MGTILLSWVVKCQRSILHNVYLSLSRFTFSILRLFLLIAFFRADFPSVGLKEMTNILTIHVQRRSNTPQPTCLLFGIRGKKVAWGSMRNRETTWKWCVARLGTNCHAEAGVFHNHTGVADWRKLLFSVPSSVLHRKNNLWLESHKIIHT